MADIVQLQENGVKKYLKTHVNAVDGIEEKYVDKTSNETIDGTKTFVKTPLVGTKKVALVEDTGWQILPITEEIAKPGSTTDSNYIPKYRIKNGMLMLRGSVKVDAGKTGKITSLAGIIPVTWNRMGFRQALVTTATDASATINVHEWGGIELISRTSGNQDVWLNGIQIPLD